MTQCPYNPHHSIRPERLSYHLVKCRKALENQLNSPYYYKLSEYRICRWNSQHHVSKHDITQHEVVCPNNNSARKIYESENNHERRVPVTNNISPIGVNADITKGDEEDDDWEGDNLPAYNPSQRALDYNVLPPGLTPAQRANYRYNRRLGRTPEFLKAPQAPHK